MNSIEINWVNLPEVNDVFRPVVAEYLKTVSDTLILPKFGNLKAAEIDIKTGPNDLVTVADRAAESWLTPRLLELQPGNCIGEEAVAETPALQQRVGDGYAWTIDPIDGTNNFVRGTCDFCSMVALTWNGVPMQCWIWLPVKQVLYYAAVGRGACRLHNNSSFSLQIGQRPVDPIFMSGSGNTKGLEEPRKSTVMNRMRMIPGRHYVGSAGVLATRIAEGKEDFLIHGRATPWDHAPVDLLCRESGGHVAMVSNAKAFNALDKGPIMAASSLVGWQNLQRHVWSSD